MSVLEGITHVVADSDLDGLMAAAVLKACKPDIEVIFAHAALVRGGSLDEIINRNTAMCDLPFHPDCGLYLDHHMTIIIHHNNTFNAGTVLRLFRPADHPANTT